MRERAMFVLGVLVVAALFALAFREQFAAMSGERLAVVVYLLMALMLVGGGLMAGGARTGSHWLRNLAIWAAIGLALALVYPIVAPLLGESTRHYR